MAGEKPLVSIICNTYNHERYIAKAIDSFLCQKTNFGIEVLIHDDCSTDNTAMIVKEYEKKYPDIIKPIYAPQNRMGRGINVNMNFQYPRAIGKYIAFCEGDDFWIDKNKLQKQVDFLEKDEKAIGCVHKYIVVDKNGNETDEKTFGQYDESGFYTLDDFATNELPSQIATLVCRNIFTDPERAYPKELVAVKIQGDIRVYLYLLNYGYIYRMAETMSAYRFICEKGGQTWSSQMRYTPNGYRTWELLCEFEEVYKGLYGKHIDLSIRKKEAAIKAITDAAMCRDKEHFLKALRVIVKQRGTITRLIGQMPHKLKKAYSQYRKEELKNERTEKC